MFRRLQEKDYDSFYRLLSCYSNASFSRKQFQLFLKTVHKNNQVWVKYDIEDRVIACATVEIEAPNEAKIGNILVLPTHQNRGIENELYHLVLTYAQKRGCQKIRWTSGRLFEKT